MIAPPENLPFGPILLVYRGKVEVDTSRGLVPFFHFEILTLDGTVVGYINFNHGDTAHITQILGHIGYEIKAAYRGNNYAYFACVALKPFIQTLYQTMILTSDPHNVSSLRTIKKLGATFINEIDVPRDDPAYETGSRKKRRFKWNLHTVL